MSSTFSSNHTWRNPTFPFKQMDSLEIILPESINYYVWSNMCVVCMHYTVPHIKKKIVSFPIYSYVQVPRGHVSCGWLEECWWCNIPCHFLSVHTRRDWVPKDHLFTHLSVDALRERTLYTVKNLWFRRFTCKFRYEKTMSLEWYL